MLHEQPFRLIYLILCEDFSEDEEGRLHLHRVLGSHLVSSDSPEMPPLKLSIKAVASFYLTDKTVKFEIRLAMLMPDGQERTFGTGYFGTVDGVYMPLRIIVFNLTIDTPGVYWFRAYHAQDLIGEYPFTVTYHPAQEALGVQ